MDHLPCEVLSQIFSNLSFKDKIKCEGVCKAWASIIRNSTPGPMESDVYLLYSQETGLRYGGNPVNYKIKMMDGYTRPLYPWKESPEIHVICFTHRIGANIDNSFEILIRRVSPSRLQFDCYPPEEILQAIGNFINPKITQINFSHVRSLFYNYRAIIQRFPIHFSNITVMAMEGEFCRGLVGHLPPKVKTLSLVGCDTIDETEIQQLVFAHTQIEILNIVECPQFGNFGLTALNEMINRDGSNRGLILVCVNPSAFLFPLDNLDSRIHRHWREYCCTVEFYQALVLMIWQRSDLVFMAPEISDSDSDSDLVVEVDEEEEEEESSEDDNVGEAMEIAVVVDDL